MLQATGTVTEAVSARRSQIMDDEISSILVGIKERYRNLKTSHRKHYLCHLKNVKKFELLELIKDPDGSNGKPVLTTYSNLFNGEYAALKPAANKIVVVQGEAGVGKTMLCLSILEDWADGKLFQEFQIIIFLPLRNVASASTLSELLNMLYPDFNSDTCTKLATYLEKNKKFSVLLIADGWEDLQLSQCQKESFFHSLLFSNDIIPTSSVTVLITTTSSSCIQIHTLKLIDRFITLTGFDRMAIESILQSEFEGDIRTIGYLTAQLNDNPLIASTCSTPLNLAILCNLCRSNGDHTELLPKSMTKLCEKLVWTLAATNIKCSDSYMNIQSLSKYDDLPEELKRPWLLLCELAFKNLEKSRNTFSQSDVLKFASTELKRVSYFGLIKPILELHDQGGDTLSSFLHPYFKEYLASLHLAKQPHQAQLTLIQELPMNTECDSCAVITFWHFFISNYVRTVASVNPDVIAQVLKVISIVNGSNRGNYFVDLCHLSFEAKNSIVNDQVFKAMYAVDKKTLKFGNCHNVYDCDAMIYVIENVKQECEAEINFQRMWSEPRTNYCPG